ncbi:MAG: type IVB secretion system coupling complex protein DotM/IcmP, partial [Pseudomonadota bacterium]
RVPDPKALWRDEGMWQMKLKKERAQIVFVRQVGPLWTGVNALNDYTKALFAIFAARIAHDTEPARQLLYQMARTYAEGEIDYTGTLPLLKKHFKNKAVQRVIQRHAYVYTIMAEMLALARTDGVQASADFLWLKPTDRVLWYILNCIGRQTVFCEVAGIWSHWIFERQLGRSISVPQVDCAVAGLEAAMAKISYVPTEKDEEEHEKTSQKKDKDKEKAPIEDNEDIIME